MKARVVRIQHPNACWNQRALQFNFGGRTYYVTPYALFGRNAFGPEDGIKVVTTYEEVVVPEEIGRNTAAFVEATGFFERTVRPYLAEQREWFRNPEYTKPPGDEDAPDYPIAAGDGVGFAY